VVRAFITGAECPGLKTQLEPDSKWVPDPLCSPDSKWVPDSLCSPDSKWVPDSLCSPSSKWVPDSQWGGGPRWHFNDYIRDVLASAETIYGDVVCFSHGTKWNGHNDRGQCARLIRGGRSQRNLDRSIEVHWGVTVYMKQALL